MHLCLIKTIEQTNANALYVNSHNMSHYLSFSLATVGDTIKVDPMQRYNYLVNMSTGSIFCIMGETYRGYVIINKNDTIIYFNKKLTGRAFFSMIINKSKEKHCIIEKKNVCTSV